MPAGATLAAFRLAHDRGIRTILNAAPAMPLSAAWSAVVDTLVVNEGEAALIGEGAGLTADSPGAWAEGLQRLGYAQVILTLGPRGAYIVAADGAMQVPAWSVDAIDTTGAGDGFVGGLAVALAEGQALNAAVRFACAVGALATRRWGRRLRCRTGVAVGALVAGGGDWVLTPRPPLHYAERGV